MILERQYCSGPGRPIPQACGFALLVVPALLVLAPRATVAQGFANVPPTTSGIDILINGTSNEDWGYGAAFLDCDGDGDLDLYIANQGGVGDWLFQQNPDHTFTNIAGSAGCADDGNGRGVKFADFDNDGDEDIFLANHRGPNRLYRNNGDGTFTDVADASLASGYLTFGAAWGDFNADGYVDLYVVNRGSVGAPQPNQLFVNNGDGTFTDRAPELGVDNSLAGLEAVWVDYDNDGDVDLYLSNDKHAGNHLWRNNGDGTFTDVSVETGTDISIDSMGIAVGDFDGNGFIDFYLTNTVGLTSIENVLLRSNGDGTYSNAATELGVTVARYGWGCAFFDYDNDMDLDLYVVNWMTPLITGDRTDAKNVLFRNNGNGSFTDVSDVTGASNSGPGYGVAVGDYDNDGRLDMFVVNNGAPPVLYHNVSGTTNHWLKVLTQGTESNRDGIGARVTVTAGGVPQFRDVSGGESYLCDPSREVEFGLAGNTIASTVDVRWPSGIVDRYTNVAADQTLLAVEGSTHALIVSVTEATVTEDGVRVSWNVSRGVGVDGFRVYRSASGGAESVVSGDALLSAAAREFTDTDVAPGRVYQYVVAGVEPGDVESRSAPVEVTVPSIAPAALALEQNQPNPFNPGTTIWFDLPEAARVRVSIYDSAGALVRVLLDGTFPAGRQPVEWTGVDDAGNRCASGIYFYRLETPLGERTRKMVLLK